MFCCVLATPHIFFVLRSCPSLQSRLSSQCVQSSLSELVISATVMAGSLLLFCYWFRYVCLLILAAETPRDHSEEAAEVNQLSFPVVRSSLRKDAVADLETLRKCLERDFAIITYLLEHTPIRVFDSGFEQAMLRTHFRIMSMCVRLTSRNLRRSASDALEEMLLVVEHLANELGQRGAAA